MESSSITPFEKSVQVLRVFAPGLQIGESPAAICQRAYSGSLDDLEAAVMDRDHLYFLPLRQLIKNIKSWAGPLHERYNDARRVTQDYEGFIAKVCSARGHRRHVLLRGCGHRRVWSADLDGRTALHKAAMSGKLSDFKRLVNEGADLRSVTHEGQNVLHYLTEYGRLEVISWLDKNHRSLLEELVSGSDSDGKRPIHMAVRRDPKPGVVRLLLELGSEVDARSAFDYTPAHWAAKHGHDESLQILLAHEADPTVVNQNGDTPLALARREGRSSCVVLLAARNPLSISLESLRLAWESSPPEEPLWALLHAAYLDRKWLDAAAVALDIGDLYQQRRELEKSCNWYACAHYILGQKGDEEDLAEYCLERMAVLQDLVVYPVFRRRAF